MYDLIIIGAGPAGLTAAIYAARSNMRTLILERGIYGGLMQSTDEIENYPSYKMIKGSELSQLMYDQAISLGAEYKYGNVISITEEGNIKKVKTSGGEFEAYSIIIATGANPRKLGVKGEEELSGRGVSYCAVCDGAFFKKKELVVIGGGDSAVEEANFLTKYASKVTVVHRKGTFRAQPILQQRLFDNEKVDVVLNSEVKEIKGENNKVVGVEVYNNQTEETTFLPCDGVFIYVGMNPNTEVFKELPILNEQGYLVTDEAMQTSMKGVFGAGDVRDKFLRQIITATGDGSIAAMRAQHYVEGIKG